MRKIIDCEILLGALKYEFGNPRKTNKIKDEIKNLRESIQQFGVWRDIGIDENNNVIFGNKLSFALKEEFGNDYKIKVKKLSGYTKKQLKAINIKDNLHEGEWDFDFLENWEIDLKDFDISYNENNKEIEEKELKAYNKVHYLLSIDVSKIESIKDIINQLYEHEGIEIEQSQN